MIGFTISGFLPLADPAWELAGERGHAEAMREAAGLARAAMLLQLGAGIDKDGRPLRAIAAATRSSRAADVNPVTGRRPYSPMGRSDPANAPLQASGSRSRTRTLLRVDVVGPGLFVHWARDPHIGINWGEALARHAAGFSMRFQGRWARVPSRDVIGMAPPFLRYFEAGFGRWWALHRSRLGGAAAPAMPAGRRTAALATPSDATFLAIRSARTQRRLAFSKSA